MHFDKPEGEHMLAIMAGRLFETRYDGSLLDVGYKAKYSKSRII